MGSGRIFTLIYRCSRFPLSRSSLHSHTDIPSSPSLPPSLPLNPRQTLLIRHLSPPLYSPPQKTRRSQSPASVPSMHPPPSPTLPCGADRVGWAPVERACHFDTWECLAGGEHWGGCRPSLSVVGGGGEGWALTPPAQLTAEPERDVYARSHDPSHPKKPPVPFTLAQELGSRGSWDTAGWVHQYFTRRSTPLTEGGDHCARHFLLNPPHTLSHT